MFVRVYASGTNVQRLARCSQDITGVIYTAYSQLEQTETDFVRRRFYCTHVQHLIEEVAELDERIQPSWNKIWGRPLANEAFVAGLLQSLVGENSLRPELNLEAMTAQPHDCFMLLVSANKREMTQIQQIAQRAIPQWHVKVLNGDFTTNKKAEAQTQMEINRARRDGCRGVIVLANQMGSRSYSVPEIQSTVIAYDRGSVDATTQKVSRCLTPGQLWDGSKKTHGHIVDLSFDPNRAENLERIILDEAVQVQRGGAAPDFAQAVRYVLSSINLFRLNEYGHPREVTEAELFEIYSNNDIMLRVADISVDVMDIMENGMFDILREVSADDGKKRNKKPAVGADAVTAVRLGHKRNSATLSDADRRAAEAVINAAIRSLNMSATSVFHLANLDGESYRDCINIISKNPDLAREFQDFFGVSASDVLELLNHRVLNEAILDVIVQNSKPQASHNLFN